MVHSDLQTENPNLASTSNHQLSNENADKLKKNLETVSCCLKILLHADVICVRFGAALVPGAVPVA